MSQLIRGHLAAEGTRPRIGSIARHHRQMAKNLRLVPAQGFDDLGCPRLERQHGVADRDPQPLEGIDVSHAAAQIIDHQRDPCPCCRWIFTLPRLDDRLRLLIGGDLGGLDRSRTRYRNSRFRLLGYLRLRRWLYSFQPLGDSTKVGTEDKEQDGHHRDPGPANSSSRAQATSRSASSRSSRRSSSPRSRIRSSSGKSRSANRRDASLTDRSGARLSSMGSLSGPV